MKDKVDGDDLWVEAMKNGVIYNEQMTWVFLIQMLKLFDYCHCRYLVNDPLEGIYESLVADQWLIQCKQCWWCDSP